MFPPVLPFFIDKGSGSRGKGKNGGSGSKAGRGVGGGGESLSPLPNKHEKPSSAKRRTYNAIDLSEETTNGQDEEEGDDGDSEAESEEEVSEESCDACLSCGKDLKARCRFAPSCSAVCKKDGVDGDTGIGEKVKEGEIHRRRNR